MKRIVTIQDLSCVGKCSLTIALPVLSALGLECCALPTAVLSTHTAFDGFVRKDLTEFLAPVSAHWQSLGLQFDAIYTGYLASPAQIDFVEDFFVRFGGEHTLRFVDPVMADQGRLYAGFDKDFPVLMRKLCARADIITPNITEACLLTGTLYRETLDERDLRVLLEKLLALGPRIAILTGVRTQPGKMGVAAMDASGTLDVHLTQYIPAVFHGTGDLFASVCVGLLTLGHPVKDAIALASDYVVQTLRATAADPNARWYGVNYEATLPLLLRSLEKLEES